MTLSPAFVAAVQAACSEKGGQSFRDLTAKEKDEVLETVRKHRDCPECWKGTEGKGLSNARTSLGKKIRFFRDPKAWKAKYLFPIKAITLKGTNKKNGVMVHFDL